MNANTRAKVNPARSMTPRDLHVKSPIQSSYGFIFFQKHEWGSGVTIGWAEDTNALPQSPFSMTERDCDVGDVGHTGG